MKFMGLAIFPIAAALFGQQASQPPKNSINSTGDQNINVNVNNGILIVVKPQISQTVRREMGGPKAADNLLTPGHDKATWDCPHNYSDGGLALQWGGGPVHFCKEAACDILNMGGESYLSITRGPNGTVSLTTQVFSEDGKILAAIENDKFYVNKNNVHYFHFEHPDAHTLLVKNDENRPSLKVRFANPTTMQIEGRFYSRRGSLVTSDADGLTILPLGYKHSSSISGPSCGMGGGVVRIEEPTSPSADTSQRIPGTPKPRQTVPPQSRSLTSTQKDALGAAIDGFSKGVVLQVVTVKEDEPHTFARQIYDVAMTKDRGGAFGTLHERKCRGTYLFIHDGNSLSFASADALAKALARNGIPVTAFEKEDDLAPGVIRLVIGEQ